MTFDPFTVVLVCYDAVGLLCGAWLLWRRGRARAGAWMADCAIFLVLAVGLLAGAVAIGFAFRSPFGLLRAVAHGLFCVGAPLLLVRGIAHVRRGARWFGWSLAVAAVGAEAAYVYALEVEPFRLEITRHEVVTSRLAGESPVVVAVLADLQTDRVGEFERRVFEELDALRADLILLPGDYLQLRRASGGVWRRERRALAALFNGLTHRPRYGIWGVDGDTDTAADAFRGTPARPLRDEVVLLEGEPALQLIGLSRFAAQEPLAEQRLQQVEAFDGLSIVLGHSPDFALGMVAAFESAGPQAVDCSAVFVAGHTHGGQVVIPFLGPPLTLSRLPRRYASGLHRLGESVLFVSRGIGMERGHAPRVRFNCRPELAVLTLRGPR